MMDALEKVGGKDKLALLREIEDPALVPILRSWPTLIDITHAMDLGFKCEDYFEQAVRDYKESLEQS